jgi:hypothetical protein
MKRRWIIAGAAALALASGGSVAAYAAVAAPAQVPTQTIRSGPDIADYCIQFGNNRIVYDWDQVACPVGDYPLSFVSMPTTFTLDLEGTDHTCTLSTVVTDGVEADTITCP